MLQFFIFFVVSFWDLYLVSQGVWGCVIEDVIISSTCKIKNSKIKLSLCFTTTNGELMLLTIESKWLKAIVHMTKVAYSKLFCSKQVQFFISIHICDKFDCWPCLPLLVLRYSTIYFTSRNHFAQWGFGCSFDNYF